MSRKVDRTKDETVGAIRRILRAISDMPDDDMAKLLDSGYDLDIRLVRRRGGEKGAAVEDIELDAVVTRLSASSDRDDALGYLLANFETKRQLEILARHLDIPLQREDRVEHLRTKIVEATAGSRLRSEAIQGDANKKPEAQDPSQA